MRRKRKGWGPKSNRTYRPPVSRETARYETEQTIGRQQRAAVDGLSVLVSSQPTRSAIGDTHQRITEEWNDAQIISECIPDSPIVQTSRLGIGIGLQSKPPGESEYVLEEFHGFVERICGDIAHVTLQSKCGEVLYGEYPTKDLQELGIAEWQSFTCTTVYSHGEVQVKILPIPFNQISSDDESEIHRRIDNLTAGDSWNGESSE